MKDLFDDAEGAVRRCAFAWSRKTRSRFDGCKNDCINIDKYIIDDLINKIGRPDAETMPMQRTGGRGTRCVDRLTSFE
jgi:hypothetical protein